MKRKLITLLAAFLVLGGLNVRAADLVVIHAGDSAMSVGMTNERGGYAGKLDAWPNKLTWGTDGKAKYLNTEKAPMVTTLGSADRFWVQSDKKVGNFISFYKDEECTTPIALQVGNDTYTQFVVFRSKSDLRVLGYTSVDSARKATTTDADALSQILSPKGFSPAGDLKGDSIEGFIAVNATGFVDEAGLMIVVHNGKGVLSVISYKDYVSQFANTAMSWTGGSIKSGDSRTEDKRYYPLYIKAETLKGRWATPDDFADCSSMYHQFTGSKDGDILKVKGASATAKPGANDKEYDCFAVKQVDYVNPGPTTHNLILNPRNVADTLLQPGKADYFNNYEGTFLYNGDSVIPLFILQTDNALVLSVSRQNELDIQTEENGVIANKLEVRKWGEHWYYDDKGVYKSTQISCPLAATDTVKWDEYSALQKFAIWIDIDGYFKLYPAGSYAWAYGMKKETQTDQIIANSVLLYNIRESLRYNVKYPDRNFGVQIGACLKNSFNYIGTAPAWIQDKTEYAERKYEKDCCKSDAITPEGRFYFLKVNIDTTKVWQDNPRGSKAAFARGAYNYGRDYVLAIQKVNGSNNKRLVAVPKEELRTRLNDEKYWRFPYDSVNMAAHWEIKKVTGGYLLLNMLGDTLQYNFDHTEANAGNNEYIAGGYIPINGLWPGDPANTGVDHKYFRNPGDYTIKSDGSGSKNWFAVNDKKAKYSGLMGADTTLRVWNITKAEGVNKYGIDLKPAGDFTINLVESGAIYKGPMLHNDSAYWQKNYQLSIIAGGGWLKSPCVIPAGSGLEIERAEIDYVPTYGPFYTGEKKNTGNSGINTNDADFIVNGVKQDSLTAYTFLEGKYTIIEANNGLRLGVKNIPLNKGSQMVEAPCFMKSDADSKTFELVPLSGTDGRERQRLIQQAWRDNGEPNADKDTLGLLYGETYKWYLVKYGDKFLTFDWINYTADIDREKLGFIFTDSLANALPVRLYQPLVGDKKNSNFLFQFYIPNYKYHVKAKKIVDTKTGRYFDTAMASGLDAFFNVEGGGGAHPDLVCFATLSNQIDFIYATLAYSGGGTSGTRFSFTDPEVKEDPKCDCIRDFISPDTLSKYRLLSFPLDNKVWFDKKELDLSIAIGDPTGKGKEAIVSKDNATTLTHTWFATIKNGKLIMDPKTSTRRGDSIMVFENELDVPLYYVVNEKGEYLTVVDTCELLVNESATAPDVNGIQLEWRAQLKQSTYNEIDSLSYDQRVLQLFAISGCKQVKDVNGYGEFIYLPLASYQWDYKNKAILKKAAGRNPTAANKVPDIKFNEWLGKQADDDCKNNDLENCYRISQYSGYFDTKRLIVANASTAVGGNLTPVEFKLKKKTLPQLPCGNGYYLVKDLGFKKGYYYTFDATVKSADSTSMFAHWQITTANDMISFKPELDNIYGKKIRPSVVIPENAGVDKDTILQTKLLDRYYINKPLPELGENVYECMNTSKFTKANGYAVSYDTVQLECITKHAVPFIDLEEDYGYNLFAQLAILEAAFLDRSLTWEVDGVSKKIYNGGKHIAYQTYIKNSSGTFGQDDVQFLNVYKVYERKLNDLHIVPYYAFSVGVGSDQYFLNVNENKGGTVDKDSVYWTKLDADEMLILLNEDKEAAKFNLMPTYKFCLPKVKTEPVYYGPEGEKLPYQPVYLQTLDYAINHSPYLVIAGSATKYVTSVRLEDAILPEGKTAANDVLRYNIYSMDYSYIDSMQVTSWIIGGQATGKEIWVPVAEAIEKGSANGLFTNFGLVTDFASGVTFLDQSKKDPVNYGIMTGGKNAPDLKITFVGDTMIGKIRRHIWYYRIQLGDLYLTDASDSIKNAKYCYNFVDTVYPYGYFRGQLPVYHTTVKADRNFVQTFGFRYVEDSGDKDQRFYIVSQANYRDNPTIEKKYRLLAEINNQLVFVEEKKDALVFQWGSIKDGDFTGLQVVGKGGIFGVQGGIKFLDTKGKVDIYSIDGRLIKSTVLTGGDQVLTAPRGIAIVKSGTDVVKVVVQ